MENVSYRFLEIFALFWRLWRHKYIYLCIMCGSFSILYENSNCLCQIKKAQLTQILDKSPSFRDFSFKCAIGDWHQLRTCNGDLQGHSTNNFAKMHSSIQYDKKKSCLRHFQVFFCIAGKKLSVPFSQQLVHSRFPSQQN